MTLKKLDKLDKRIPTWNSEKIIERDCPICFHQNETRKFIRPDGLHVTLCKKCGTYYVSPAPNDESINSFYEKYHEQHFQEELNIRKLIDTTSPYQDIRIQTLSSKVDLKHSSLLDIGCGKGFFLAQLNKLGTQTYGIDSDRSAIEIAKSLGVQCQQANITDISIQEKFDIVTLNDVIEHPLKPEALITSILKILKKDGLLLIWTPNGSSTKSEYVSFRVDLEHMQYLTSKTVNHISKKFNMDIIHIETLGFPNIARYTSTPNKKNTRLIIKNKIKKLLSYFKLYELYNYITLGKSIRQGDYHLFFILKKVRDE